MPASAPATPRRARFAALALALLTTLPLVLLAGCTGKQTPNADIVSTDSSNDTLLTIPDFDQTPTTIAPKVTDAVAFCTAISKLNQNAALNNKELSLHVRATVFIGILDNAESAAPENLKTLTGRMKDFFTQVANLPDTDSGGSSGGAFLSLVISTGIGPSSDEFVQRVKAECGITIELLANPDAPATDTATTDANDGFTQP